MIKSWANSATRRFAEEGKSKFAGLDVEKAEDLLAALNAAAALSDLSPLKSVGPHEAKRRPQGSMGDDRQWALAHLLSL
jgi:proteic killer suppression protein